MLPIPEKWHVSLLHIFFENTDFTGYVIHIWERVISFNVAFHPRITLILKMISYYLYQK